MNRTVIDCGRLIYRREAHIYLAEELRFPKYYGRNLDALSDCLSEYSGLIVFKNADVPDSGDGYFRRILNVFSDAEAENPNLSCVKFGGELPQKNPYHENLERAEFVMTRACTGSCKHCSEAGSDTKQNLDGEAAARALLRAAAVYDLKSVMAFGGEPLLRAEDVAKIMRAAKNAGVESRQIITNGCFTRDEDRLKRTARLLMRSGVNCVLLSADAFHQETLPLDSVKLFAEEILGLGITIKLNPAWLVSREDNNQYNLKTREILSELKALGVPEASGNIIFPEGNAKKYLGEYFNGENIAKNPYVQDPENVKAISLDPDGTLYGESVSERDILDIIGGYQPKK